MEYIAFHQVNSNNKFIICSLAGPDLDLPGPGAKHFFGPPENNWVYASSFPFNFEETPSTLLTQL